MATSRLTVEGLPTPPLTPQTAVLKPLSYQQTGWLEAERAGRVGWRVGSRTSTNIHACLHVRGALDTSALRVATSQVIARHTSLRTAFSLESGEIMQHVLSPADVRIDAVDASDSPGVGRKRDVEHVIAEALVRPFDFSGVEPLLRLLVARLNATEHIVVVILAHLVSDGASLRICVRDLLACYTAAVEGRTESRPALMVDYGDFALWQRRWLTTVVREHVREGYLAGLGGVPSEALRAHLPDLEGSDSYVADQVTCEVGAKCVSRVRSLAIAERTAPFVVVVAAYVATLSRYMRRQDFIVAVPVMGRRHAEAASMIGFFTCFGLLRAELTGDPTVRVLIARVARAAAQVMKFDGVPYGFLEELVRTESFWLPELAFSANVVGTEESDEVTEIGGAEWEPCGFGVPADVAAPLTRYDLNLLITYRRTGGMQLTLRYRRCVMSHDTVRAFASDLLSMLATMPSALDCAMSELNRLVSAGSYHGD